MACTSQNKSDETRTVITFNFPVFIDNREIKDTSVNIIWMNDGNHNPLYFGKLRDTIRIEGIVGHQYLPPIPQVGHEKSAPIKKGKFDDYYLEMGHYKNFKNWDSVTLNIQIDTSQFVGNAGRKSYPVLIENKYHDTIYIGYGNYIPIITEAMDSNGLWKPIEERFIYMCGSELEAIILPPKEFVLTSELVYTGNFKTKLRIKFGKNYSREFVGSINETQFESEWNSKGERKTAPRGK